MMSPAPAGRSADSAARPAGSARSNQARDHLLEMLTPVVAATGHDLEELSVTSAGRRSLVRLTVDADGGVDLDAVADISRAVSEALDGDAAGGAAFAGPYVLEVSSPGVDRPLSEPRHWHRAILRLVQVPVAGVATTGRVLAADDAGITLEVEGVTRQVSWADLGRGRVQVEFNHAVAGDDRSGLGAADDAVDDDSDPDVIDDPYDDDAADDGGSADERQN